MVISYKDGSTETEQLVPPWSFGSINDPISPTQFVAPFGEYAGSTNALNWALLGQKRRQRPLVSAMDLLLDPSRVTTKITLRCVTSEAIFGILAATVVDAH